MKQNKQYNIPNCIVGGGGLTTFKHQRINLRKGGIIFSNILSYNDHQEISNTLKDYFLGIKNNQSINYLGNFLNIPVIL